MISASETHPSCAKCKLYQGCKSPFMAASGSIEPRIMVVGESPGAHEDQLGQPFVGPTGKLLRTALEGLGLDLKKDVIFTNVVRCRPEGNKTTARLVNHCKIFVLEEIQQYQPETVLLMGNSSLLGVLGESGITAWNGVMVQKDRRYVPLFHPAFILRDMSKLDAWLGDIANALDGDAVYTEPYERIYPKTLGELEAMVEYLGGFKEISYDTEVVELDPFRDSAKLLAVSFAAGNRAYAIPVNHRNVWNWFDKEFYRNWGKPEEFVLKILDQHDGHIIGHNIKFDLMQTYAHLGKLYKASGDSMVLSHLLDSRKGIHGLKRLAGLHLGMYDYDKELKDYLVKHKVKEFAAGGSYDDVPLRVLLPYAALDAEATHKLHPYLYKQLSPKQKTLYHQLIMPASDTLTAMQCSGIATDKVVADSYVAEYEQAKHTVYAELMKDPKVKRMCKERPLGYEFNPNSSDQLGELYYKWYKIPVPGYTETGKSSTRAELLKALESKYPIVATVRMYKLLGKMLSTYLKPCADGLWDSSDGFVRTTFNLHGTVTGRLSSSNPVNLQNIPTPEKEPGTLLERLPIKNIFTHSWGKNRGVIMSVDYSGMELRVFASVAKCWPMIKIHKSGKDFHSMVAIMSSTHKPIESVTVDEIAALPKSVRYRYKWTNWTLLYGGGAYTLHTMYGVPMDEAEETVKMYYALFPEVLEYKRWCEEFTLEHGYIESPFGRREYLPYIGDPDRSKHEDAVRSAVNMPVQSAASDTLLCAMIIIDKLLEEGGYRTMLVNTVHDSLMLDVPNDEVEPVAELCKSVMENIKRDAKTYMPKVDFSWLICPLKADVDVGQHYGALKPIEEWLNAKY